MEAKRAQSLEGDGNLVLKAQILEHNMNAAHRRDNLMATRARRRLKGSGKWKEWLSRCILRACFQYGGLPARTVAGLVRPKVFGGQGVLEKREGGAA